MARAEGDLARAVRVGEWDQGFGWDFLGSTLMIGIERVECMGVVHMCRRVLDGGGRPQAKGACRSRKPFPSKQGFAFRASN